MRRLVDDVPGLARGLVPPIISDNDKNDTRSTAQKRATGGPPRGGMPIVTSAYDRQGNVLVPSDELNITLFPYPRTFATGTRNASSAGELRFMRNEPVGHPLKNAFQYRQGGRNNTIRLFQDEIDIGGGDGTRFPPTLDVWRMRRDLADRYDSMRCDAMRCDSMRCDAMRPDAM